MNSELKLNVINATRRKCSVLWRNLTPHPYVDGQERLIRDSKIIITEVVFLMRVNIIVEAYSWGGKR